MIAEWRLLAPAMRQVVAAGGQIVTLRHSRSLLPYKCMVSRMSEPGRWATHSLTYRR
jgi:hypothetical protein